MNIENIENLNTLATYLEQLPEGYEHFDMKYYFVVQGRRLAYLVSEPKLESCGTVACAIGHGPAAGIPIKPEELWGVYCARVFGLSGSAWTWCFGEEWVHVDNTPQGAAKRIRHYLTYGLPEDAEEQRLGDTDYCYATDDNKH